MEVLQPYMLGWLVPTVLSAVCGYLVGALKKMKADADEGKEMQ